MAVIAPKDAASFLKSGFSQFPVILLFGQDDGLIRERAEIIAKNTVSGDAGNIMRLDGDAVSADPLLLADEANAIAMFGGIRAIRVKAGGKSLVAALEPLLKALPQDARVIIEAGDIKPAHALRALLEKARGCAALACYSEDSRSLAQWLDGLLEEQGVAIDKDARLALLGSLGQDRKRSRMEMEKLFLYAHGEKRLSLQDIEAIVTDAAALSTDHLIDAAFSGQLEIIETETRRVLADGMDAGALLGFAIRHGLLLLSINEQIASGQSVSESIKSHRVSWKRERNVETHVGRWPEARLKRAIQGLGDAVFNARRTATLADALAIRALWSLALSASRR
jgi:DNA polymerase III subunit delta